MTATEFLKLSVGDLVVTGLSRLPGTVIACIPDYKIIIVRFDDSREYAFMANQALSITHVTEVRP